MSIRVLQSGLLTTVQDLGRLGSRRFGVVMGGAIDAFSLRKANLAVGNEESAAGLEITLAGPALEFTTPSIIALCGAEMNASVGDLKLPLHRPVLLPSGAVLNCGHAIQGCRAYLAIAGAIDVPIVMQSRSTYLRAGIGGYEGRSLRSGDELATLPPRERSSKLAARLSDGKPSNQLCYPPWSLGSAPFGNEVRVVRGSEWDWLTSDSQQQLLSAEFTVTPRSDRMGMRLTGPQLQLAHSRQLLSEAVCPGVIQIPSDGQPIVLLADCATHGGYAKAACVISADLPLLAQKRPHDKVRFRLVEIAEAQAAYRQQVQDLQRMKIAIDL